MQCRELETTLADASKRLAAKNKEIKQLDQLLQERDAEIERLIQIIEEMKREKKTVITFDDSEEWRVRFIELQNRARKDIDNYENELSRKDQIILELRDKINQLLCQSPVITGQQFYSPANDSEEKDALISKLRTTVGDMDTEIRMLRADLAKKPAVEFREIPAPKVVRVTEENLKEIRYEKDPYLIEQNARLSKELDDALVMYRLLVRRTEC